MFRALAALIRLIQTAALAKARIAVRTLALAFLAVTVLAPVRARAQSAPATGSPAPAGSVSGSKPLDVRGQSRMQGLIQTKEDGVEIDFVKPRKDFREEILKTSY